jgi:cysteine desulfurase
MQRGRPGTIAQVPAYLDHAATSPTRPETVAAMLPWLEGHFGNPSGSHSVARAARTAVDEARDLLAELLGAPPGGIVFTSGGTEADNLAVLGALRARARRGIGPGVVVTSPVEHEAVLGAVARSGAEVRWAPVDGDGVVDLERLAPLLGRDVAVVSVMLVNNETGVVQPVGDIVELVRRRAPGAVVHTDAVQAPVWLDVREAAAGVDLLSVSAHKFGGPQGVGALAVAEGVEVDAIVGGGGQERQRRPGTHNVAGIVGMAAAAEATAAERPEVVAAVGPRRDRLVDGLLATVGGTAETAARDLKVPGHAHVCIEGIESEALLVLLDDAGVCASAGSACASGAMEPSHVLLAMGLSRDRALGSLRMTLGPATTDAEVEAALAAVPAAVDRLRGRSPRPEPAGAGAGRER